MKTKPKNYTAEFMIEDPTVLATMHNMVDQTLTFLEHPRLGDLTTIYVMIDGVLADTGFFDLGDFYPGSDYMPILVNGEINCAFELM